MNVETKLITPEMAECMLKFNDNNRSLRTNHVNQLAEEMKGGRWKPNGESIKMSEDRLLDGQHRLKACIQAATPFESVVVTGLNESTFDTIDVGKSRTHRDTLSVLGEKNVGLLAQSLLFIRGYIHGVSNQVPPTSISRPKVTNIELQALLDSNPKIRDSVEWAKERKSFIKPLHLSVCHYIFSDVDKDDCDKFMHKLITGANLEAGDPVLVVRESYVKNAVHVPKSGQQACRWTTLAFLVKGWNAFREGKKVKNIHWKTNKAFPKAK